jgi:hypothetical protein
MGVILNTFLKRIPREGFKSLTVPALALVLVVLISIMGGTRNRMAADLEDVIDNFPLKVEVSDPITSDTGYLQIDERHIALFTEGGLSHYLKDTLLARGMGIAATEPDAPVGQWVGITATEADEGLSPLTGAFIEYLPGYDEGIFRTREPVAVVNAAIFERLNPAEPMLTLILMNHIPEITRVIPDAFCDDGLPLLAVMQAEEFIFDEVTLRVAGILHGAGDTVYSPFWTVSEAAAALRLPVYSGSMSAQMADNRLVAEFGRAARPHFARAGDVDTELPLSLTIFDGTYNDVIRRLEQNIRLIDVSTPFIYGLSVLIGFVASYLLTRRRKPEFAVMRSIGVNRRDVFFGALAEQAALCLAGAAAGFALFGIVYGYLLWLPLLLFTACYALGSVFAANSAAAANVLKILRERE